MKRPFGLPDEEGLRQTDSSIFGPAFTDAVRLCGLGMV